MHTILASFFLQGGMAWMQSAPAPIPPSTYWVYDINEVRNPYGIIALGFDHDWGRWNVSLEGRHFSSVQTQRDHGTNTVSVNVTVHPFR